MVAHNRTAPTRSLAGLKVLLLLMPRLLLQQWQGQRQRQLLPTLPCPLLTSTAVLVPLAQLLLLLNRLFLYTFLLLLVLHLQPCLTNVGSLGLWLLLLENGVLDSPLLLVLWLQCLLPSIATAACMPCARERSHSLSPGACPRLGAAFCDQRGGRKTSGTLQRAAAADVR
jgi:hypothetical protein